MAVILSMKTHRSVVTYTFTKSVSIHIDIINIDLSCTKNFFKAAFYFFLLFSNGVQFFIIPDYYLYLIFMELLKSPQFFSIEAIFCILIFKIYLMKAVLYFWITFITNISIPILHKIFLRGWFKTTLYYQYYYWCKKVEF